MSRLLIISTGLSDVQLVLDGVRFSLRSGQAKAVHDGIRAAEGTWSIVPTPLERKEWGNDPLPAEYNVCAPKIEAVLRNLEESSGPLPITHAVVFETATHGRTDPHYAGEIVARYISEQIPGAEVRRFAYLKEAEELSNRALDGDRIVRSEVISRIESQIRNTLCSTEFDGVVVAATGGFPEVKKVTEEIVRLHAGARDLAVEILVVPDSPSGRADVEQAIPHTVVIPPDEMYRRRRQALDLVRAGDFLGADGLARSLGESPDILPQWVQVISWLAAFISAQPLPADCDIDVLKDPRDAVKTAIRTELALLVGDIPRAVHATVAFFESAWRDALAMHSVEKGKGRRFPTYSIELPVGTRTAPEEVGFTIRNKLEFAQRHLTTMPGLLAYGDLASGVSGLRNDVAHGEPTVEEMWKAQGKMAGVGLWSQADSGRSARFLTQPPVGDVLAELGVDAPSSLCTDLVATACARIVE